MKKSHAKNLKIRIYFKFYLSWGVIDNLNTLDDNIKLLEVILDFGSIASDTNSFLTLFNTLNRSCVKF